MATLTIPAAYIEDARLAIIYEIHEDGERLQVQSPDERPSSALMLSRDMNVLHQLLEASGDTDVTLQAEADITCDPLGELLQTMIRQIIGRLERECVYAPLTLGSMVPLMDELRWAAENVRQICVEVA